MRKPTAGMSTSARSAGEPLALGRRLSSSLQTAVPTWVSTFCWSLTAAWSRIAARWATGAACSAAGAAGPVAAARAERAPAGRARAGPAPGPDAEAGPAGAPAPAAGRGRAPAPPARSLILAEPCGWTGFDWVARGPGEFLLRHAQAPRRKADAAADQQDQRDPDEHLPGDAAALLGPGRGDRTGGVARVGAGRSSRGAGDDRGLLAARLAGLVAARRRGGLVVQIAVRSHDPARGPAGDSGGAGGAGGAGAGRSAPLAGWPGGGRRRRARRRAGRGPHRGRRRRRRAHGRRRGRAGPRGLRALRRRGRSGPGGGPGRRRRHRRRRWTRGRRGGGRAGFLADFGLQPRDGVVERVALGVEMLRRHGRVERAQLAQQGLAGPVVNRGAALPR